MSSRLLHKTSSCLIRIDAIRIPDNATEKSLKYKLCLKVCDEFKVLIPGLAQRYLRDLCHTSTGFTVAVYHCWQRNKIANCKLCRVDTRYTGSHSIPGELFLDIHFTDKFRSRKHALYPEPRQCSCYRCSVFCGSPDDIVNIKLKIRLQAAPPTLQDIVYRQIASRLEKEGEKFQDLPLPSLLLDDVQHSYNLHHDEFFCDQYSCKCPKCVKHMNQVCGCSFCNSGGVQIHCKSIYCDCEICLNKWSCCHLLPLKSLTDNFPYMF